MDMMLIYNECFGDYVKTLVYFLWKLFVPIRELITKFLFSELVLYHTCRKR